MREKCRDPQWGHKVNGVRALGDGRHEVRFVDSTTVTTSLLVGADGARSRVRPLLSDATPEYVGTSFVETYLFDCDTHHPSAAEAVGNGSLFVLGPDGKGIFAHRESGGILHAYVELSKPQDWFVSIDFTNPAAVAVRITQEFDGWAPSSPPSSPTATPRRSCAPTTCCRSSTVGAGYRG